MLAIHFRFVQFDIATDEVEEAILFNSLQHHGNKKLQQNIYLLQRYDTLG